MDAIRGLWWKLRMMPVLAWSLGALAISVGYAVHDLRSLSAMNWQMFGLVLAGLLVPVLVVRAVYRRPVAVWLYSVPLRRLPVLSEWVTAFPLMVGTTVGTYYLLAEMWEPAVGWAALLHALLSVGWLMQTHLRDLMMLKPRGGNIPRTNTTVAYVTRRFGKGAARHVPAAYFLLTAFVGTVATLQVAHVFFFTVLCALLGAISAWNTHFGKIRRLNETHGKMVVTTLAHGLLLALWVAWM